MFAQVDASLLCQVMDDVWTGKPPEVTSTMIVGHGDSTPWPETFIESTWFQRVHGLV